MIYFLHKEVAFYGLMGVFMAKQQIFEFENGATLVYQKQNVFNGYSFVIGFRSGAQLDGKYKGLSHLLEHLLFRSTNDNITKNILNKILTHTINQNAFTTQNSIAVTFSATQNNVEMALENCMKMITSKKFSEEQIRKEIEIVKQEINMYKDAPDVCDYALESLLDSLMVPTEEYSSMDILGNPRTLKSITPEILRKYVSRYFNLDNLVISITSNKSAEDAIKLCEEHIFSKLTNAKSSKYIIPYDKPAEFHNMSGLVAIPNRNQQNVQINLLLRERSDYSEDIDREYAYEIIEGYLLNSFGSLLWNALRVKNNLVYNYGVEGADFGKTKFKVFNALTSGPKMRKTITEICKVIRDIADNGVPEKLYNTVMQALTDRQSANLQKFKNCSAKSNYNGLLEGIPFVDYKKVNTYIQNMTYEEFNSYIQEIYKRAEVSLSVYGNFDRRKMYYLVEIEQMLGNTIHLDQKEMFNQPIGEFAEIPDMERIAQHQKLDTMLDIQETINNMTPEQTPPVRIDDEKVK